MECNTKVSGMRNPHYFRHAVRMKKKTECAVAAGKAEGDNEKNRQREIILDSLTKQHAEHLHHNDWQYRRQKIMDSH